MDLVLLEPSSRQASGPDEAAHSMYGVLDRRTQQRWVPECWVRAHRPRASFVTAEPLSAEDSLPTERIQFCASHVPCKLGLCHAAHGKRLVPRR